MAQRLDQALSDRGFVSSRSQAESYIRLGQVTVNGTVVTKTGALVGPNDTLKVLATDQYVSRAALKLASVAENFALDFRGKVVLDVGSSTGGFTQYALQKGAKKVLAVEVGTDQMHPSLRRDPRIELHEKTDIRDFDTSTLIDIIVADVSFVSLREILPAVLRLCQPSTILVTMVKPQFEAPLSSVKHKGVVKNDRVRRDILNDFELWARRLFVVIDKADSSVAGAKGNIERFYVLRPLGR